jgi:hypothetical protein
VEQSPFRASCRRGVTNKARSSDRILASHQAVSRFVLSLSQQECTGSAGTVKLYQTELMLTARTRSPDSTEHRNSYLPTVQRHIGRRVNASIPPVHHAVDSKRLDHLRIRYREVGGSEVKRRGVHIVNKSGTQASALHWAGENMDTMNRPDTDGAGLPPAGRSRGRTLTIRDLLPRLWPVGRRAACLSASCGTTSTAPRNILGIPEDRLRPDTS